MIGIMVFEEIGLYERNDFINEDNDSLKFGEISTGCLQSGSLRSEQDVFRKRNTG